MKPGYKPNLTNRPKHFFEDNAIIFLTVRTVDGQWFLQPEKYKKILLSKLQEKIKKFSFKLLAYVILNNHYHLLIQVSQSELVSKFMRELNGSSAREINKADCAIDRKIWWNYFDKIIRSDEDFYKHLNYIHQNPVKHGISKSLEYQFSSYNSWVKKRGQEYVDQSFEKYPIVDFVSFNDEF